MQAVRVSDLCKTACRAGGNALKVQRALNHPRSLAAPFRVPSSQSYKASAMLTNPWDKMRARGVSKCGTHSDDPGFYQSEASNAPLESNPNLQSLKISSDALAKTEEEKRSQSRQGRAQPRTRDVWRRPDAGKGPRPQQQSNRPTPVREKQRTVFSGEVPEDATVAIIGGGLSGLICAQVLSEQGIRSTVFDTVSTEHLTLYSKE
jgi:hypothetical protein